MIDGYARDASDAGLGGVARYPISHKDTVLTIARGSLYSRFILRVELMILFPVSVRGVS